MGPATVKVYKPDQCAYNGNCGKCLELIVFDVTDNDLKGTSKEIASAPNHDRPHQSSYDIKDDELPCRNRAHTNHKIFLSRVANRGIKSSDAFSQILPGWNRNR